MRSLRLLRAVAALLATAAVASEPTPLGAQSGGPYQVVQGTIAAGGGTSAGGNYSVTGAVDFGVSGKSMSASRFCVDSGGWSGLLPAGGCAGFYPIAPCRVYDSRISGGPVLHDQTRVVPVVASACGLPPWAHSVAVNVTAATPASAGRFAAFPASTPQPDTTTLNFRAGQSRANNAVLRLGLGGELAVHALSVPGGSTHLVVDVTGYFVGSGF